jgi:ketol-acid reductoisomerase
MSEMRRVEVVLTAPKEVGHGVVERVDEGERGETPGYEASNDTCGTRTGRETLPMSRL